MIEGECVEWQGHIDRYGYGRANLGKRAHRLAYEEANGPIPEGLVLDHLCSNRRCVNPAHLEAVTQRENVLRGESLVAVNATKVACLRGHPFDDENTYRRPDGGRACKTCARDYQRAYRAQKRKVA